MEKTKNLKTRLISSLLILAMLVSSLIGTTFAWFTDSVSSSNNKIISGSLSVDLELLDKKTGEWSSIKESHTPIFNYDNWEPGYVDAKIMRVENEGSLALKWKAMFVSEKALSELADVIDVYVRAYGVLPDATGVAYPADRSLDGYEKVGTVAQFVNTIEQTTYGNLEAGQSAYLGIALKMQETAGNEYQKKEIGAFDIQIVATQLASEEDSFGKDYDDDAKWPENVTVGNTASVNVKLNADNTLADPTDMTSDDGKISASLQAGTKMKAGATEAKLIVTDLEESKANITLNENEAKLSLDVHVEGVAEDNTTVIKVYLAEALPKGLNMGNYKLYHVDKGNTVEMTLINDSANMAHNTYEYDPATGDVVLYMATFSEVTAVAEPAKWEGERDYSWYTNAVAPVDGEAVTEYIIANADQLAAFGAIVGGMDGQTQDSFSGKTVKLVADINIGDLDSENGIVFYPIGYNSDDGKYEKTGVAVSTGFYSFKGTFDGNGNTISNFYQNTWEMKGDHNWYDATLQYYRDGMGLFGKVYGGTVKNLTIDNFSSDGEITTTGTIAAYADSAAGKPAIFENIAITNCNPRVYNIGNGGIVGCAGWYSRNEDLSNADYANAVVFRNITVDQTNKISALWGTYDVSCGGILGQYYPDSKCGIKLDNCHVSAIIDVNNDVCANYQYYWYRYSGMFIGTIRANKSEGGYTVADPTGIIATDCTYSYGSWNEYWYCELVKNSSASYTHDYQFGRLTNIDDLSEIKSGETWLKEGNFALVSDDRKSVECYHIFKDSNDNLYRHFHDVADESNPNIYEDFDLNGDGLLNDLKEDRQRYYLPFGQVFNGLGYGVKPTYTFDGFTLVEDGTVISGEKFNKNTENFSYKPGEKIYLKDILTLTVDKSKLSQSSLYVAASPVGDDSVAKITYSRDVENWENNYFTVSEGSTGVIKIVITDYFYCTPTVIYLNPAQAAEKFTANPIGAQNAYTQITLGDLFAAMSGTTIGNVTATVTDPAGNGTTVTGTSTDWATKTIDLTKDGTWTVVIKDDDAYCSVTTVTFTVNDVDKFKVVFQNTNDYLYRVGNENAVILGKLFSEIETAVKLFSVNVSITNVAGNAEGTFTPNATWTNGTIQFTGTGVVTVTISADGAKSVTLQLEVVNAYNVTSYSGGSYALSNRNSVLLNDITMSSGATYALQGATLFGNGFTFDVTAGAYSGAGQISSNYVIYLDNAKLDNVQIVGAVYTSYGATASSDYNRPVILSVGNNTITNCYISNCASPVRINSGNLTITGSTLKGGNFANIDVRSGHLILDNVTTINQALGNDQAEDGSIVIGLGIVVYYEMVNSAATSITVKNGLKQYNHISSNDKFSNEYANQFISGMFDSANSALQYNDGNTKWVNTGIILMTSGISVIGAGNKSNVSFMGATGNVYTPVPTAASVAERPAEYVTLGQGVIAPTAPLDHNNEAKGNYIPKEADKNDYCYFDGEKILISMDRGDTFQYDPFILNATKLGQTLNYTVKFNENAVAIGSKISFSETGEYFITYTYEDPYNYSLNENGELVSFTVSYTKTDVVSVAIVEPEAEHAKFTFATNSTATEEILYNNNTYISATGVTADGTNWGKITVGDKTINYPIVMANVNRNTSKSECQVFYYVFKNVIVITDANGTVYSHDNGTGTDGKMPSNLAVEKGNELKVSDDVFNSYNDTNLSRTGGKIFCFSSSSQEDTPEAFNGALAYKSPSGLKYSTSGGTNNAGTRNYDAAVIVQYQFTDSAGATYYYYVGYKINNPNNEGSGDGEDTTCLTPDTLVTLADGTQVRVDSLTGNEELLVWNMETGKLDKAPIMFIDSETEAEYEIIKLIFSDGTEVKVIYEHGFWDYDLNKYVYLDRYAEKYIGHTFAKQNGDALEKVQLVDVVIETEVTTAWSPVTAGHLCYFVNGMLSMPGGVGGLFNIFEVDAETMTYDYEAMQRDIETYGLYTYEELNAICPLSEEMFNAAGGAYLKISIGKGNLTLDELIAMINRYSKFFA